jgi:hypothetical protein
MIKEADLAEILAAIKDKATGAAATAGDAVSNAGSSIKDWYLSQPATARSAIINGLLGAGVGAVAGGGLSALTPHDDDDGSPHMSSALMGALFGGTAGAGISLGKGLISGDIKFPGSGKPEGRPLMTRMTDPLVRGSVNNLGVIGGAALPLMRADGPRATIGTLIDSMARKPGAGNGMAPSGLAEGWANLKPSKKLGLLSIPAMAMAGLMAQRVVKGDY